MRFTIAALAAAFVALGAGRAAAQASCQTPADGTNSCTIDATVSVTVPTILHLSEDLSAYTFATVTAADLDAGGITDSGHPTLTGKGNVDFRLLARAAAATFGGGAGKSVNDMTVAGTALNGTTDVQIGSGARGSTATTVAATGHIAFNWDNATASTYTTTITFTIVSP